VAVRTCSTLGIERLEPRVALASVTALDVRNDQSFDRVAEPVFSGVPLPESLRITDSDRLRVLDGSGREVPAQFRVLGRWGGGPAERTRPIRWLEVGFAADVPARGTATYTLDDAGRGAAAPGLQAVETDDRITVTTGPARFEVGRTAFTLFHSVWLDLDRDGGFSPAERVVLPDGRNGAFVRQGTTEYVSGSGGPRSVVLEEAGPLRAVIRAEGFHTAAGAPLLRYVTRLTFHAGQSHVVVDHTIIEGRLAGTGNGGLDSQVATTIDRAGLRVGLTMEGPTTAALRGGRAEVHRGALPPAAAADILQESVSDPEFRPAYRGGIDGVPLEVGERATRAWLGVADSRFGVAVTTRDFHRKQPQRLRVTGGGTVEVEFPASTFTIRQAMGVSEQVVFWFHPAGAPLAEAERVLEGFAKDRLLALPPGDWMRQSGALGDVPGGLPDRWRRVDGFLQDTAAASLAFAASPGASGLMHYLDMPIDRFQAAPRGDGSAPDPDRISWGNSYWDPAATLLPQFARTADRRLLSDLLFPMARHFFTTDMYDPDDPTSFTAGIGGARGLVHRGLWTGDYHYLESLWDYAALAGDRRAVERGLTAARTYAFHPQFALTADQGGFQTTTRTLSQKFSTMMDAWLASGDPAIQAALDAQMQEFLERRFTPEGFVTGGPVFGTAYDAEQAFMVLLGIHDTVFEYFRLTGNPRAREFVVTVPQRIAEHHRVSQDPDSPDFMRFHTTIRVTRLAGGGFTVTRTTPRGNSDDFFYLESHVALATALARAWACGAPEAARQAAEQLFDFAVPRLTAGLLDKPTAMMARRLLPGLALLTDAPPPSIQRVIHPEARAYRAGEQLVWQLVCSAAVGVTGRPTLPLRIAGRAAVATYATGSGTDRLTFHYTIRPGDDAAEIALGGAVSFPDGAAIGGPSRFDPALPGGDTAVAGVTIDTRPPQPAGRVVGPASRRYRTGAVLGFAVTFSEPVFVSGSPRLTLRLPGQPQAIRQVVYVGGSGTTTLVFRYAVRPGDAPPVRRGLTLERRILGGTIVDAAGNLASRDFRPPPMAGIVVVARA